MRARTVSVMVVVTVILLLLLTSCGRTQKETVTGGSTLEGKSAPVSSAVHDLPTTIAQQEVNEQKTNTITHVEATVTEPPPVAESSSSPSAEQPTASTATTAEPTITAPEALSPAEKASKADFVLATTRVEQKNENKIITISLIPTAPVASIEFDLDFNNYTYDSIDGEIIARTANKDVISTVTSLRSIHVTIQGTNDFTMDEGDIATVYFTGNGSLYLTLNNIQGTDPAGKALVGK